ncbi:acyl-CoA dehydrogenase-like protein [Mycetohabitans endofungorum]|uniref:Acyl-CoA dehydrogenase-like protein n=1 Tax=Mycetohabitans endofungorum TaxID=417203 RepID=A0A2P5K8T3_9BURK|nr:acyl-CoA dehydrogenase-like protein [Mycetohabitans endofungorum]
MCRRTLRRKAFCQAHGAAGICDDFPRAYAYTSARMLRQADGPDEVHRSAIARLELASYLKDRDGVPRVSLTCDAATQPVLCLNGMHLAADGARCAAGVV